GDWWRRSRPAAPRERQPAPRGRRGAATWSSVGWLLWSSWHIVRGPQPPKGFNKASVIMNKLLNSRRNTVPLTVEDEQLARFWVCVSQSSRVPHPDACRIGDVRPHPLPARQARMRLLKPLLSTGYFRFPARYNFPVNPSSPKLACGPCWSNS